MPRPAGDGLCKALLGALWCLGHLGGAGTRSRRGFGSLALLDWKMDGAPWPEMEQLPILSKETTTSQWTEGLNTALSTFERWFGPVENFRSRDAYHQPHLGQDFSTALLPDGFARDKWDEALNLAGTRLQEFRQRRQPDYSLLKEQVLSNERKGGKSLTEGPERAAFGLPLAFRFGSLPGSKPVMLVPYDDENKTTFERHGSLLFIRLCLLGDRLHPLFVRLDGDIPGVSPPAALRGSGRPLRKPTRGGALLDEFLGYVSNPGRRS